MGQDHEGFQADSPARRRTTRTNPAGIVASITPINTPTEVDHYQLRRIFDVYVMPKGEDLGTSGKQVKTSPRHPLPPEHPRSTARLRRLYATSRSRASASACHCRRARLPHPDGAVRFVLRSLHHPAGRSAGLRRRHSLPARHGTTINVMSLMGVIMMAGIVVSN